MDQNSFNARIRVIFFGTPDFAIPTLQSLIDDQRCDVCAVVTQPDRPAGRGKKLKAAPTKLLAQATDIPVFTPRSIKKELEQFTRDIKDIGEIDLGIVIAFGQILPQAILDYPQRGCVNLHASLLPRWRGAAPIQHAILAGDSETGVCLMQMEAGLDCGPVIAKSVSPITPNTNYGDLHDRLAADSAELLMENLIAIANGTTKTIPQPTTGISYAEKITFRDTIIDWTMPAERLERQIRAFSPAPGAITQFHNKRLKILAAQAKFQHAETGMPPGSVAFLDRQNCEIVCGQGLLSLSEVQLEGRRAMPIAEFLRGAKLEFGMKIK